MEKSLAKTPLGFFPTPLTELTRFSRELAGPRIFMKRDDLTGLALGGNKTRKLEYILADALNKGCNTIITAGAQQSNHCRQTAAAAAKLGLECHLMLGGEKPSHSMGNLLLDELLNCHIHWCGEHRKGEDIENLFHELTSKGKSPYIVPYGGSNELGTIAFMEALKELDKQCIEANFEFDHIVFASSSGATHAGLILGKYVLEKNYQVVGINIDKSEHNESQLSEHIVQLVNNTAKRLCINNTFTKDEVTLIDDYVGEGYGVVGTLEQEAIQLVASVEGIFLDPVYTGRAMGGLIDMIRKNKIKPHEKVLFWHTGGAPALFAYASKLSERSES